LLLFYANLLLVVVRTEISGRVIPFALISSIIYVLISDSFYIPNKRYITTNRKVTGSIPDGVIRIFH
jgi:hypothetical protein